MPIYAYRCTNCGLEKDFMRKVSDPVLTTCPSCSSEDFAKQLTAPSFHLKGSGWYASDFKGGAKPLDAESEAKSDAKADAKADAKTEAKSESKSEAKSEAKSEGKAETKTEAKSDSTQQS
jgi:putative FmdB family regulatory protein